MPRERITLQLAMHATILVLILTIGADARAQQETVLYDIAGDLGTAPYAGLVFDSSGNLYGAASSGPNGTVFELSPSANGWKATVLYSFSDNGSDGIYPFGTLIFDKLGNLYGTTYGGGTYGSGTVFELTPNISGGWTEQILHSFNKAAGDGVNPNASLMLDSHGNLYGTTVSGGAFNDGMVFELEPNGKGTWREKAIHSFGKSADDGQQPTSALVFDSSNNLYGTTLAGGPDGVGTVFELTPTTNGGWIEKILHAFDNDGADGLYPYAGVIFYDDVLLGTTTQGGAYTGGTVFALIPRTDGVWHEKILHSFNNNGIDGQRPYAGVVLDSSGNVFGTTVNGGSYNYGTAFELIRSSDWEEEILHNFDFNEMDGVNPNASMIFDDHGNLYGTTSAGGPDDEGTVFEIVP